MLIHYLLFYFCLFCFIGKGVIEEDRDVDVVKVCAPSQDLFPAVQTLPFLAMKHNKVYVIVIECAQ